MPRITYTPGSWLGIVRAGTAIIVGADTDQAVVNRLWEYLGSAPKIHGVLNELTRAFGTELTGMPPFGIVALTDRMHVVLRGEMTLHSSTGGAGLEVSGREVATWSERSLPLPEQFELVLGAASDGALPQLPLDAAVVGLAALQVTLIDSPAPMPVVGAAPDGSPLTAAPGAAALSGTGTLAGSAAAGEAATAAKTEVTGGASGSESPAGPEAELGQTLMSGDEPDPASSGAAAAGSASSEGPGASAGGAGISVPEAFPEAVPVASAGAAAAATETDAPPQVSLPDEPLETGGTSSYDHLWDGTVARSVEDAAVRFTDPQDEPPAAAVDGGGAADLPGAHAAAEAGEGPGGRAAAGKPAETVVPPSPNPIASVPGAVPPAAAAPSASAGIARTEGSNTGGLIESVPWMRPGAGSESASPAGPPFSLQVPPAPGHVSSAAFGAGVAAALGSAAGPGPAAGAGTAAGRGSNQRPHQGADPDHDGQTVMRRDLNLAAATPAPAVNQPAGQEKLPTGPVVLARLCGQGHANPPARGQCSVCGAPITGEARQAARPGLGRMHISTGEVVELNHSLIIGRQPSVSRVQGGGMPRLVQVRSNTGDISRSHVEVRLEGWDVLLVDLKATNGTVLVRQGQPPRRLGQGDQVMLIDGDIAELGDGVSLLFEGIV